MSLHGFCSFYIIASGFIILLLGTTVLSECLFNDSSVVVSQKTLIPRPSGQTIMKCEFRVPYKQLLYVEWKIDRGYPIYVYNPDKTSPSNVKTGFEELIQEGGNDISFKGGHVDVKIRTNVTDNRVYQCLVYLKDFSYCKDSKKMEFVHPELTIKVNNSVICTNNKPCNFDASLNNKYNLISGHVNNCQPQPQLSLMFNGANAPEHSIIGSNIHGYCQASISLNRKFCMEDTILFSVVDNGNTYEVEFKNIISTFNLTMSPPWMPVKEGTFFNVSCIIDKIRPELVEFYWKLSGHQVTGGLERTVLENDNTSSIISWYYHEAQMEDNGKVLTCILKTLDGKTSTHSMTLSVNVADSGVNVAMIISIVLVSVLLSVVIIAVYWMWSRKRRQSVFK